MRLFRRQMILSAPRVLIHLYLQSHTHFSRERKATMNCCSLAQYRCSPSSPFSLDRIGWVQVLGQEAVGFRSRLFGELGIEPVELMPAGCVLVDLVLELLVRGLE